MTIFPDTLPVDLIQYLEDNKNICLFLDFDGVLVEIADTPDAVQVPSYLRDELQKLQNSLAGAVAIVSGRDMADIDRLLQPVHLPIAGDHGNQRRRATGETLWLNPEAKLIASDLAARLRAAVADDDRLLVEHKPSAVALHYRQAPEREQDARALLEAEVNGDLNFSIITGKMVVEARARGANKGEAVRSFMQEPPFRNRVPIFIGDDVTDEDGFAAVQAVGGAGIKVGPESTGARFRINSATGVPHLLDLIADRTRPV